jgi:hypothetical protein
MSSTTTSSLPVRVGGEQCVWEVRQCVWEVRQCVWEVRQCVWEVRQCVWEVRQPVRVGGEASKCGSIGKHEPGAKSSKEVSSVWSCAHHR